MLVTKRAYLLIIGATEGAAEGAAEIFSLGVGEGTTLAEGTCCFHLSNFSSVFFIDFSTVVPTMEIPSFPIVSTPATPSTAIPFAF